jgi:hypothetical protein
MEPPVVDLSDLTGHFWHNSDTNSIIFDNAPSKIANNETYTSHPYHHSNASNSSFVSSISSDRNDGSFFSAPGSPVSTTDSWLTNIRKTFEGESESICADKDRLPFFRDTGKRTSISSLRLEPTNARQVSFASTGYIENPSYVTICSINDQETTNQTGESSHSHGFDQGISAHRYVLRPFPPRVEYLLPVYSQTGYDTGTGKHASQTFDDLFRGMGHPTSHGDESTTSKNHRSTSILSTIRSCFEKGFNSFQRQANSQVPDDITSNTEKSTFFGLKRRRGSTARGENESTAKLKSGWFSDFTDSVVDAYNGFRYRNNESERIHRRRRALPTSSSTLSTSQDLNAMAKEFGGIDVKTQEELWRELSRKDVLQSEAEQSGMSVSSFLRAQQSGLSEYRGRRSEASDGNTDCSYW